MPRLLEGLPEEEVRRVLASARRRKFARNEVVFHEGDLADAVHLISKGRVAVRVTTALGDVATLSILGEGDIFGEMALLTPSERTATVTALEPTETLSITRENFERLRRERPAVMEVLASILAEKVRRASAQLVEALYVPADLRVLRRLLDLAAIYGDGAVIPLRQEDLAGMAGTSRATVNRVLREEVQRGTLELGRGRIRILKRDVITRRAY